MSNFKGAPDGGVWIPYCARKLSHFPHPTVVFRSYPASQMAFAQFEFRIPRNFVANPESRRQKGLIPHPANPHRGPHEGFVKDIPEYVYMLASERQNI